LRIDVDGGDPYAIPPDNPYAGTTDGRRKEIWALGLRNPWRVSFDLGAGLLYTADVGQDAWEEINAVPLGVAGLNYGWRVMEGAVCFNPSPCNQAGLVLPRLVYSHAAGCSITGGHVYRGSAQPALVGHYFYADYCSGWIRGFRLVGGVAIDQRTWVAGGIGNISSFGQDAAGELYVVSHGGTVYRIEQQ
jgi:glucose/arabinose dehydrogenase